MGYELTDSPEVPVAAAMPVTIPKRKRDELGVTLYSSITTALGDRSGIDANLDYYNDLYEMTTTPRDWPWPNAANVFVPLIPTQVDTLAARLSSSILIPRLFLVNGNTTDAAQFQHEVERYYNAELARNDWAEKFYQWMHLSLRDGTSIMEVLWKQVHRKKKVPVYEPATLEDGSPDIDIEKGEQRRTMTVKEIEVVEFDNVDPTPVELKDFLLIPAYATSIEEATAVARKMYLSESDLWAMVKSGILWEDSVRDILSLVSEANDEVPLDPQGTATLEAGGQVNVSGSQGSPTGAYPQARGPFIFWRVHHRGIDLDSDGQPEENVFYVHAQSQKLAGVAPYDYWHGRRPFVALSLMPRLRRFYGYSVVERLRTLQEELNAIHNHRLDAIEIALSPVRYRTEGSRTLTENRRWGPDAEWIIDGPQSVGFLQPPQIPIEGVQEESMLKNYAETLTGLSAPMLGGTNSGRRTAKEIQQAAASAGVRVDLMASRMRQALKEVFWQIHHLKLQFGPEDEVLHVGVGGTPERFELNKFKLAQDYDLSIAGLGGPIDKTSRQQSMLFLYSLLMKNPLVMSDPMKVYKVTNMLLEEYDRVDIPTIIGTADQLQQQIQAQQQAAQQQAAVAAATGQHPSPPGQQHPGQPPQQHPQPSTPPGHGGPTLA